MVTLRPGAARGTTRTSWLDSRHTFSFGGYHDPAHMGFGPLRVLNDDTVAPGGGFATHAHRDMEILTWVLRGALAHRDSLGHGSTIRPGDAQLMRAGTGIAHSEYNASDADPVHFLQIWIVPDRGGLEPGYQQHTLPPEALAGRLALVVSPPGGGGAVEAHQDARVWVARLADGGEVSHALAPDRAAWVHLAAGAGSVNGMPLAAGDGAAVMREPDVRLAAAQPSEVLVFDLPTAG